MGIPSTERYLNGRRRKGGQEISSSFLRESRERFVELNLHDQKKNPSGRLRREQINDDFSPFESSTLLSGFCPLCLWYNRDRSAAVGPLDGASDYRWYVGEMQRRCGDRMYGADLDVCLFHCLVRNPKGRETRRRYRHQFGRRLFARHLRRGGTPYRNHTARSQAAQMKGGAMQNCISSLFVKSTSTYKCANCRNNSIPSIRLDIVIVSPKPGSEISAIFPACNCPQNVRSDIVRLDC